MVIIGSVLSAQVRCYVWGWVKKSVTPKALLIRIRHAECWLTLKKNMGFLASHYDPCDPKQIFVGACTIIN